MPSRAETELRDLADDITHDAARSGRDFGWNPYREGLGDEDEQASHERTCATCYTLRGFLAVGHQLLASLYSRLSIHVWD